MTTTPRRVEWIGPEGWTVWADEDGVHLRSRTGDSLEALDLTRLVELIAEARAQMDVGHIPAPKPLSREQLRELHTDNREAYAAKRAKRAIEREFAPDSSIPF